MRIHINGHEFIGSPLSVALILGLSDFRKEVRADDAT